MINSSKVGIVWCTEKKYMQSGEMVMLNGMFFWFNRFGQKRKNPRRRYVGGFFAII
jgi:hypothetical protein